MPGPDVGSRQARMCHDVGLVRAMDGCGDAGLPAEGTLL